MKEIDTYEVRRLMQEMGGGFPDVFHELCDAYEQIQAKLKVAEEAFDMISRNRCCEFFNVIAGPASKDALAKLREDS